MTYVVDASVAIKWFVREALHDEAARVLDHAAHLQAPDLIVPEVVNVAWKKAVRGEIGRPQAQLIATAMRQYVPTLHPSAGLIERALEIALALNHPVYDCLYLACADHVGGVLITADQRLCRALADSDYADLIQHLESFRFRRPKEEALPPLRIPVSKVEQAIRIANALDGLEETLQDTFPVGLGENFSGSSSDKATNMWFESPTTQQLFNFLDNLSRDERADILAIMWLHADDSDWDSLRKNAFEVVDNFESFLFTGPVPIADYLRRGLEILRSRHKNKPRSQNK